MNNPYLDATFLYQSMTKSATFKASETRKDKDKSRSRLPRAFINRLRSKDGSTAGSGSSSKADSPSLSEPELKIKFKMDNSSDKSTTTASSPPSSPLVDSRSKREKKKENNRKEKEKKENYKKEKKNAAAAAASAKKGGGGKGADKASAELEAKLKKRKKKWKKAKKSESESESESDSDSESEDGSDSESDDGSDSDDSRGYAKGKLRIRKQRSISMNSLLQDFFIKMDQQAQEPALSLVVTPPSSRSPTIGAASSDFDRQYSLTESGSGESNVLLLTRSQAAMKRARDGGVMGTSLLATDELDTESDDRSSSLSTKHSSGSGSFPITPTRRGLHGVAMGRSDDGVLLPGGGHTAARGLASSASAAAAAPSKSVGLEADGEKATTRRRKKTKAKTKKKNEGEDGEDDDEAEGFYVGTGVDMEEDDDDGEDSFGSWSDDATTTIATPANARTAAKASVAAAIDPSTKVVADTSENMEDQEETNFYGGFVESGSDSSSDSDSDSDDDSDSSDSDSSGDDEQATNYVMSGQPNNGFEEVLATFAKQYMHILEDGKQLAKSDEQEELKEVLQLRTLQQLQELSLQLIKSTQPKLVAPHATPMKVTRSAPVVLTASASASTAKSPSPKGKRRKPPNTGYGKCMDWNGTFQDILWVNEGDDRSLVDRYHALKDLAHDFNHAARTYATIIIEEAFLPDHQKTIPPIHSLGGRAGGEKYVHAGILFKFATDARGIYSGDEYAMKAAGHELKGLINFYKVHHFGICVPLMTIIDYRGFRLVAQALLPIGDDTLVYGSSDAGVNVRTDSREIEKALAAACYELNLAKHAVYPKHGPPVAMYGPGDMEGHFGLDGRYYLIDFARVFPPETPEPGTKGAFLYRLLRPELVVRNGVALSSDSFSRFGGPTMDLREPHDTNTKNATDVLVEELVPQFAQWLDKQYNRAFPDYVHRSSSSFGEFLLPGSSSIASPSGDDTIGSPESAEDGLETSGSFFSVMDSDRLPGLGDMDDWASPIIQELHRMGINVRYLGLARSRCTHEVAKMVLLSEMVCRVVKNLLRERLRERMRALRTMAEEPYKEARTPRSSTILELFNLLLGDPAGAAERWWTYDIKTEISKRFKHALTIEELEPTYDLRRSAMVPYPALFVRLQLQTAVRLTPEAINDLKNGELTSLVSADIRGQGVNGKDMNIVSTAEAIALAIRCLDGATSAREADRLLRLAIRKFEKAIGRMPGDMELINYYANFLFRKVYTFVHHGMGASGPSPGSRRTTRGRRRKSRVASDEFATWAEDKWDNGDLDDFDEDDESHYWEERRASNNSPSPAGTTAPHASSTNSNANANAFVGLTSGPNPLDLSGHKLKLHRSGSNNISGTGGGVNDDDLASPAMATTTTTATTTTNVNAAAAKWAESLRWHITLLSKMLKLFKTCENFVMLNILADLCKQFATNLQQMDRDLKRAYARKLRCFAAAKQRTHQSLATSAPTGSGANGGGQSQSMGNLSSSASPSKHHHHHGSGVGKSQLTASLPGLSLPLAGGHASHASALVYERSLRRNEVLVERERDRRRDLLHSYQLQALYLTNECYTAITVIESTPLLDFVQSTMGGGGGGLTALRPQKTTSAPSLRPSSMPMPLSLTTSATLPTLTARPASHMSVSTADRVDGGGDTSAQVLTSAGSSDEYHIMKEKRSSIGMHIYPHRSASFIGKKMMPFVYFRWAELLYLRAHILEKKTRLEKLIRLTEVAEGLRSEEDEARWEKEKREEVEYLRYYSGKRYRDAFQLLDNTESRNIVQRNDDEPKSLVESNGARTASGEKKDARRWVMSAYPTNAVKENIALASIMELYRCNLEKHGRWGALGGGSRRSEEDLGGNPNGKERRSGSDAKKEDDNESGGVEPQEKRAKTKKEKKEAKAESGGSAKKKKKHGGGGGGKKKGGSEEAEKSEKKNEAAAPEAAVVESDRARRRREREEAEKALLMQEMKKAKDVARNKNKIQRPDDEDDDDTGDARKLRIVVDEDVLRDDQLTTTAAAASVDNKSDTASAKKNEKSDGGRRKAKTKAKEGGSGKASPAEAKAQYGRARQAPKKAPSISAQLRSQKLKTFDDDWLPAECLSDDLFLSVVKNCPVQEVILGADAARRAHKDPAATSGSAREGNPSGGAVAAKKRRGGSPSSENLYLERRDRRSVQISGVDDIDIGRHSAASQTHASSTRDGGGGVATSFASTRRVLTSPFASSSSATLPAPGSFATRSFSSSASAPRGSGIAGGSATAPPAISVDALQKAAASGSFNELTHLTLKRYEDITDAQLESILRIQYTTLTSLRLEGCPQLSDKTLQHLASSLFGPNLRHLSFKNCPRITNRGVLDLVKTTTSLVSLCLDGCEKISNKPIIYLAKGCPSLRHLSLMGCKKISDKSITEIANHNTNLASLRVSSDRVTDASLVLMGKKLPQLYSLTMANCNITNEGLQAVCWGVAASQLTHLCFVECDKIGGKEQLLFNVVHRCPNLLYLHVKKSSPPAGKK